MPTGVDLKLLTPASQNLCTHTHDAQFQGLSVKSYCDMIFNDFIISKGKQVFGLGTTNCHCIPSGDLQL